MENLPLSLSFSLISYNYLQNNLILVNLDFYRIHRETKHLRIYESKTSKNCGISCVVVSKSSRYLALSMRIDNDLI